MHRQDFPLYRKYPHGRTWFRILSESEFEELVILGSQYHLKRFEAKTFVDRHLVSDLIANEGSHWEITDASSFESVLEECRRDRKINPSL